MVVMTHRRVAIRLGSIALVLEETDESDPPSFREPIDVEAEELSAVHPKLAKCAAVKVERRRAAK